MRLKKIMAISVTLVAMFTSALSAYATESQVFTEDGTAQIDSSVEIGSKYTVRLPAMITLAKNTVSTEAKSDYVGGYTVGVKGNIASNEYVNVVPDTSDFIMSDASGKRTTKPDLYANKVAWSAEDLDSVGEDNFNNSGSMIEATLRRAGKYNGNVVYDFWLSEEEAENAMRNASRSETNVTDEGRLVKIIHGFTIGGGALDATNKVKVDNKEYKIWEYDENGATKRVEIPIYAGAKVTIYHNPDYLWMGIGGRGPAVHFYVPEDAAGDSELWFAFYNSTGNGFQTNPQYLVDIYRDNASYGGHRGWAGNLKLSDFIFGE